MSWLKRLSWRIVLPPTLLALGFLLNILEYNFGTNPTYELHLSLSLVWLFLGIGLFMGLVTIIANRSFSERYYKRELRSQRAQAEGERRLFLKRFTHELDNQIATLQQAIEQGEAVSEVSAQIKHLERLSADVQKITSLRIQPLERTEVDLNYLLKEAVDAILVKHPGRDNSIRCAIQQVPNPLPPIDGDWDLLYRAILNLLDNGLKFTEAEGKVELRAREDSYYIIIEVADSGPGIDEQEQRDIWNEFYRSNQTRHISGSGMGLPYVKTVIQRHGGDVSLRSRVGEGSIFIIRLPIRSQNSDL
jgi:two-component system OmpR family sensor kinase